jgi:hypothetical protein
MDDAGTSSSQKHLGEHDDVRPGSRLCENSNFEFARRNIVSIAFNRKRTLLPITVEWRQDRKQFCALSARARFHTAWVKNGSVRARAARPFYPQVQTSSPGPGMSVWCQMLTSHPRPEAHSIGKFLVLKCSCGSGQFLD